MSASVDRFGSLLDGQRASRVLLVSIASCAVFLAFASNNLFTYDAPRMAATSFACAIVALLASLAVALNRPPNLAANLLVGSIALQVFGEMYFSGALQAPATPIALLIVPAAMLLTTVHFVVGWAILVSIGLIGIAWLDANGLTFPSEISAAQRRQDGTMSLLIGVIGTAALAGIFSAQATKALTTLAREREDYEQRAMHDALTGLPNRANFCESAAVQISESERLNQQGTLIFIDVNKFKQVNDGLGHEAGDELLVAFARRLELSFEKPALVGRFAGDEFVVFVAHDEHSYQDSDIERAVVQMTTEPFYLCGAVLPIGASFGVARLGRDGESLTALLAAADQSMYVMKRDQATRTEASAPASAHSSHQSAPDLLARTEVGASG